ncbi:hypothetical protein PSQ40_14640 [Curvibacter sp. HBC61]|uniref:Lipoprotein n=1 Tax=Curvibacter cyanobacteriorum TaxID=3026422 RepID=A0ABT5N0I2_9BURK|nr:hypothetical protein [Curvibacter sp. HBC61]MDD0839819.1 hypothetical protein [Curvibacter sp. HBC61]
MKFRLFLILLSIFGLSACATYKENWIPPTTPNGSMCVAQCNQSKQSCQFSKQLLQQRCESDYNRAMADYQSCKARNPQTSYCSSYRSKTEVINGQSVTRQECTATRYESPCKEPVKSCGNAGNDSQCESNYRSCFVSCGGVIDRYEVK